MTKHLRRISLLILVLMVPSIVTSAHVKPSTTQPIQEQKKTENAFHITGPKVLSVHLKKVYLDGFKTEKVVKEPVLSMEDFWNEYRQWQLVKQTNDAIYFQKNINDISPVSKAAGIFGIDNQHTLTIFKGSPNDAHIIQTFFQLDLDALEAKMQTELKHGIPVQSKEHFQQVIDMLRKYQLSNS